LRRHTSKKKDREVRPDQYTATLTVELKPLPCLRPLGWGGYVRFVAERTPEAEKQAALERELRGIEIVGEGEVRWRAPDTAELSEGVPALPVHPVSKKKRFDVPLGVRGSPTRLGSPPRRAP
jgi:hypothetical protein